MRRPIMVTLAAMLLGTAGAATAEPADLPRLMAALAARKTSEARFVEQRHLAMLKEPLKSEGRLRYVAPDKLEKLTLYPRPQRLSVEGDRVVLDPAPQGAPPTLSLAAQPEVGAFVEAIRGTLAGDLPALERFYGVGFEGSLADWTLRLEPKAAAVRKLLAGIVVTGRGTEIRSLEFRQTDGDRTEMMVFEDRN